MTSWAGIERKKPKLISIWVPYVMEEREKECWQNEAENEHGLLGADQSSGSQKLNDPIKFCVLLETWVNVGSVVTADSFYFN